MEQPIKISVVSPVYRAEKIIPELVKQLLAELSKITPDFEIILVEDASPDNSWNEIGIACQRDKRIKGVKLSRNFGQHNAISAGLKYIKSEWVVVMDCDLQDRPDEIVRLYQKALEGFHIVYARRVVRQDHFFKRLSSKIFYLVFDYLSDINSDNSIANFGIYHYKVIRQFNLMNEHSRAFTTLVNFLGFKKTAIEVQHAERFEGKSSYSFRKLVKLAVDASIANSNKPLRLAVKLGFIVSFLSLILAVYNILAHLSGIIKVPGFTSTIFSIWFVGGLILFIMGILGIYMGKIFDEVKARPLFVVEEEVNINNGQWI
ncbi:MAG: glycosyltransferase family 2 protein [Salinivirgaceae bacterium]|nr:glycosyltransferase family 2 protein [Salinivirgaceae bacterium]